MSYDPSMNFDAVLFDAAETLFTTRGSVGEIYGEVARQFGCTASTEAIQAAFLRQFRHSGPVTSDDEKRWWKDVVQRVFAEAGPVQNFDRFFETVYDQFRDGRGWKLFAETKEVLEELKRLKLRLGVISNFDSRVYSVMRSLEIIEFFDAGTISSETGFAKPHPEIFEAAIRALGVDRHRILLVGDNLADDVQAAEQAGLTAVLLDRKGRYPADSVTTIQNLRELLPLVASAKV